MLGNLLKFSHEKISVSLYFFVNYLVCFIINIRACPLTNCTSQRTRPRFRYSPIRPHAMPGSDMPLNRSRKCCLKSLGELNYIIP